MASATTSDDRLALSGWVRPGEHPVRVEVEDARGRVASAHGTVTASQADPNDRWLVCALASNDRRQSFRQGAWAAGRCLPDTPAPILVNTSSASFATDLLRSADGHRLAIAAYGPPRPSLD